MKLDHGQADLPAFELGTQVMKRTLYVDLAGHSSVRAKLLVDVRLGPPVAVQPSDTIQCNLGTDITLPIKVSLARASSPCSVHLHLQLP